MQGHWATIEEFTHHLAYGCARLGDRSWGFGNGDEAFYISNFPDPQFGMNRPLLLEALAYDLPEFTMMLGCMRKTT